MNEYKEAHKRERKRAGHSQANVVANVRAGEAFEGKDGEDVEVGEAEDAENGVEPRPTLH